MTSHSDDIDEMGEPHGDETPLYLRPMPEETVKGFADRARALIKCIRHLEKADAYDMEGLIGAAMGLNIDLAGFLAPWERTPWAAKRLATNVRAVAKSARAAAEMQLAGVADGIALDIEAAVAEKGGKP